MNTEKKFEVRYYDNIGCNDCVLVFNSEQEAEIAIENDMRIIADKWACHGYDYGDFGCATEIWIPGSDYYARWERLWAE